MSFDEHYVADVAPVTQVPHLASEGSGETVRIGEGRMAIGDSRAFVPGGGSLLTVGEVAAAMRVSNMTVYRLIKSGELAAVRVGHNYRIREGDVERYLTERSVHVEGA